MIDLVPSLLETETVAKNTSKNIPTCLSQQECLWNACVCKALGFAAPHALVAARRRFLNLQFEYVKSLRGTRFLS